MRSTCRSRPTPFCRRRTQSSSLPSGAARSPPPARPAPPTLLLASPPSCSHQCRPFPTHALCACARACAASFSRMHTCPHALTLAGARDLVLVRERLPAHACPCAPTRTLMHAGMRAHAHTHARTHARTRTRRYQDWYKRSVLGKKAMMQVRSRYLSSLSLGDDQNVTVASDRNGPSNRNRRRQKPPMRACAHAGRD